MSDCSGTVNRKRGGVKKGDRCLQPPISFVNGKWYCYYHNPLDPKKFGQGYVGWGRDAPAQKQESVQ